MGFQNLNSEPISRRLVHLFLHQHYESFIHSENAGHLFDLLMTRYSLENKWKDLYDVSIIRACWAYQQLPEGDLDHDQGYLTKVFDFFVRPGEPLEANLRFEDAAKYYEAASHIMRGHVRNTRLIRSKFISFAGKASQRDFNTKRAEELYLKSVKTGLVPASAIDWNPNDKITSGTQDNMLTNFFEGCVLQGESGNQCCDSTEIGSVFRRFYESDVLCRMHERRFSSCF